MPDKALAAQVMFAGMSQGWFTGKKLSDYFKDGKADWKNARRIINGTDKADTIAGYGKAFYRALQAAVTTDVPAPKPSPQPPVDALAAEPVPAGKPEPWWLKLILSIVNALLGRKPS